MLTNKAQRIAKIILDGINAATLPKSALQITVSQIRKSWKVTVAEAQEIRWILTENFK